jgi:hypothetical protein
MLTRFKQILGLPLMMAVVGNGSLVVMDIARSHVEIDVKTTISSYVAQPQIFETLDAATPQAPRLNPPFSIRFRGDKDRGMSTVIAT